MAPLRADYGKQVHIGYLRPELSCSGRFLYNENHSLSEWFKKAYGDKEKSLLKLLSGLPTAQ